MAQRPFFGQRASAAFEKNWACPANDFGNLLGISAGAIYDLETRKGVLRLRHTTLAALAGLKGMGKKDVQARLK